MLRRGSTLSVLMVLLMVAAVTVAVPSTRAAAEEPTGARLVFSADLGEGSEIYTVGVDGTDMRRVTVNTVPDAEPVWSPDGTQIAWASGQNGSRQILVANADGTEARAVSTGDSDAVEPAWSPDGAQLAFASDVMRRGELWGTRELFVVDPTTGEEPRRVSDDPLGRGGFTWTSDGRSVIYAGYCEECAGSDLFIVDVETGERVQLVADEEDAISPVTRPGASEVFYLVRDRKIDRALTQVRAIDLTTREIRQVTAAPSDLDDPAFSPDGQLLIAGRLACEGPGVCVVDLERGITTTAAEVGEAALDYSDGRTILHPDWNDNAAIAGQKASLTETGFLASAATTDVATDGDTAGGVGQAVETENEAAAVKTQTGTRERTSGGENGSASSVSGAVWSGGPATADAVAPGVTVNTSGIWGGGFQHVAAVNSNNRVLLGGDVSGMHMTTSNGSTWKPRNEGFEDYRQSRGIASVAFHPTNDNKAYIATAGGFYASTDGGDSWTRQISFSGPRFSPFGSQPRVIGNLIVVTEEGVDDDTVIYVGSSNLVLGDPPANTNTGGIWRSTNEGQDWTQISTNDLNNAVVHSLVQHPTTGKLYAAVQGPDSTDRGIWEFASPQCNTDDCASGTRVGSGNREEPYELVFDDTGELWCACGARGVHRASGPSYTSWSNWNNFPTAPLPITNVEDKWAAITIGDVDDDGTDEVVVGATGLGTSNELAVRYAELTVNQTWNSVVPTKTEAKAGEVCGAARIFWMSQNANSDRNVLSEEFWDTGSLIFVQDQLWVIGRTGPWRYDPAATEDQWCVAVRKLSDSANRAIVAGNETNSQYLVASTDFDVLTTTNDFFDITTPVVRGDNDGVTVGFDTDFNRYSNNSGAPYTGPFGITGTGARDDPRNEGFVAGFDELNPFDDTFDRLDDSLDRKLPENAVMGVGTGTRTNDDTIFMVAAVHDYIDPEDAGNNQEGGVYVRQGTGDWTEVLAGDVEPKLDQSTNSRIAIQWSREPEITVNFVHAGMTYGFNHNSVSVTDTGSLVEPDDLVVKFVGAADDGIWDPSNSIDPGAGWTEAPEEYRNQFLGHQGFYQTATGSGGTYSATLTGLDSVGFGVVSLDTNAGTLDVVGDVVSSSQGAATTSPALPTLAGQGDLDLYFVRASNTPGTITWTGATEIATDGWISIATADPDATVAPTVSFSTGRGYTAMGVRVKATDDVYDEWVYLLDRDTGLWRGGNYGQGTWSKLWPQDTDSTALSTYFPSDFTGFLVVDPSDNDHLYLATHNTLLEFTNATTCDFDTSAGGNDCSVTTHTQIGKYGPIAMDATGEHLVAASRVDGAGDPAELWVRDELANSWLRVVCDDEIFNGAAYWWTDMAIGGNERVVIVSRGLGGIEIRNALDATTACT